MRAAFSRIGWKISCGANAAGTALICAALIGRRVFVFIAAIVAVTALLKRLRQDEPVVEEAPPFDAHAVLRVPAPDTTFEAPRGHVAILPASVSELYERLAGVIVGQRDAIETLMLALIAGGHALLEGPPGLAKTLACRTLARRTAASFARISCTADLTPAEITGSEIFDPRDLSFKVRLGPLFANIVLVDEINRAPARTQAALLEALEEGQVTLGGVTSLLPDPFLVLGTMNEAEADGIYTLPAAQRDRFLLKALVDFPAPREELEILDRCSGQSVSNEAPVIPVEAVRSWRAAAPTIYIAPRIKQYIVDLVRATRDKAVHSDIERGAGPRGTLAIVRAARAKAMLAGRPHVVPSDVLSVARAALRHRVVFANAFLLDRAECECRLAAILESVSRP
jgi:MoxR-like ATPase